MRLRKNGWYPRDLRRLVLRVKARVVLILIVQGLFSRGCYWLFPKTCS